MYTKINNYFITLLLFFTSTIIFSQNLFPEKGEVFRDDIVPSVNILIPADSLNILLAPGNEESNYHWHATFIFDNGNIIDTLENIGFRLRGNTSRYADKKSFKISFNTYEPGRKWYGLEKLNINGEHNDPTVARSKICWDLLREMEVPAARSNHIRLHINNQYIGVFINVEHIDEEFVQLRYGNNDGNLFKCLWPADLHYKGSNPDLYKEEMNGRRTYSLQTNTDTDDYSDLANFIGILNNTPIDNLPCELDEVFNVDTYLKTIAFDILSGNWDGPIFNKNNFYLYHNTATGKFEYIPFDLDNTFGIDWFNIDWANRNIYNWAHNEFRPIYERIFEVQEYRDRFSFYMQQYLANNYHPDIIFPKIGNIKNLIFDYVASDFFYTLDYGFNFQQFNDSYEMALGYFHTPIGLKEFISERHNSALQQLEINNIPPIISNVKNNLPNTLQDVSITARIIDNIAVAGAEMCYQINGQPMNCDPMYDDGLHADGEANDGNYGALVPAIGSPATISYVIQAADASFQVSQNPVCQQYNIQISSPSVPLVINEFMASNDATIADNAGEYDDWVELYSLSDAPIYLGNFFLSDKKDSPDKWPMPDLWIQPGEYIVFWCDEDEDQGEFHTNFKLSAAGEFVGIFESAANNFVLIDGVDFGVQTTDISSARIPNGTGPIQLAAPTPGAFNTAPTAINNAPEKNIELIVFPNPFDSELNILLKNEKINSLEIITSQGQSFFKKNGVFNSTIKLENIELMSGIYFLKIELINGQKIIQKIIAF